MSLELDALVARARVAADAASSETAPSADDRQRLQKIAAEFESMLLLQVLRDMRKAGRWEEEEAGEANETQSLFDTLDVELASHLTKAQGFGLTSQLLQAFDRMDLGKGASNAQALTSPAAGGHGSAAHLTEVSPERAALVAPDHAMLASSTERTPNGSGPDVTSPFGWRRDPLTGLSTFHKGVDLKAAYGQEVQAAAAGRVVFSGSQGSYGTTVMVEHSNGTQTRYAHLSVALVAPGATVEAGQPVGRAGSSGRSTGPHLHFEVLDRQGRPVDPTR
jgi:murein DD-endopeptidase MepM/ murein hydrolase activator NlpD